MLKNGPTSWNGLVKHKMVQLVVNSLTKENDPIGRYGLTSEKKMFNCLKWSNLF